MVSPAEESATRSSVTQGLTDVVESALKPDAQASSRALSGIAPMATASQIHRLTTTTRRLFTLGGFVGRKPAVFLLDSGATGNFVSTAFVAAHQLSASVLSQK